MSESQSVLDGRSVLVTGAGRGMGRAYALDAAAQGARVAVNDIDQDRGLEVVAEIRANHGVATFVAGDVSSFEDCVKIVDSCVAEFGRIDGFVNNAGIIHMTPCWNETEGPTREVVSVNLAGSVQLALLVMDQMERQGGGTVVNVPSVIEMGFNGCSVYGATKGAIASLTYTWAESYRDKGIRVNAISPRGTTRGVQHNGKEFDESKPAVPPALTGPIVSYLLSDLARDRAGVVLRLQTDTLALLERPKPVGPEARITDWSAAAVAASLATTLEPALQPYGFSDPLGS